MSSWLSWIPIGNGGSACQTDDALESSEAGKSTEDGVIWSRSNNDEAVAILKTPVNALMPNSEAVENTAMHSRTNSRVGEGIQLLSQSEAAATLPLSAQVRGYSYGPKNPPDKQNSPSNDHGDPNGGINILDQSSPSLDTISHPTVVPKQLTTKGDRRNRRQRWRAAFRGREAELESLFWKDLTSRAAVAEKRRELRAARLALEQVDEALMKLIRGKRVQQCDGKDEDSLDLEEHYSRLQYARDKYRLLEESYDTMEERLDEDEYGIIKLAEELQDNDNEAASQSEQDALDGLSRATDESSGDIRVAEEREHPLLSKYLSLQGDADMVREDIAELRLEFRKLQEAQLSRHKARTLLSKHDQAIHDNFPTKEAALLQKLHTIELDVERLGDDCNQAGLLERGDGDTEGKAEKEENGSNDVLADLNGLLDPKDADGPFSVVLGQPDADKVDDSVNILADLTGTTATRDLYSRLLEQPTLKKPDQEEWDKNPKSLISDYNPQDPEDRIARWILQRLRSSYCEVELLERISLQNGLDPPANIGKWQEDVLEFWYLDSTFLQPSAYQVQDTTTELDVPSSPFADRENKALFHSGQAQLIQLVIRSSSIFNKLEFALILHLTIPKGEVAKSVR